VKRRKRNIVHFYFLCMLTNFFSGLTSSFIHPIMSQSSRRTTHSRRTRQASSTDIAVTEASFQSLALSPSPSHHSYPAPLSPYQATDQQYRHAPYNRNASSTTYLQAGCDPTTISGTPSNSFAIVSRRDQQPTIRSPGFLNSGISSQAHAMPAPDMRYAVAT
jgi:hypothetical protein